MTHAADLWRAQRAALTSHELAIAAGVALSTRAIASALGGTA